MENQEKSTENRPLSEDPGRVPEVDTEFLSEEIKRRPINRRKLLRRSLITAFLGVLFGAVTYVTFTMLAPYITQKMNPREEPPAITFPEETAQEEMAPQDMIAQDEDLLAAQEKEGIPEEDLEEKVLQILQDNPVDTTAYANLYSSMRETAQAAAVSLVTVSGITDDYDWFNNPYETAGKASGVIVAATGSELLILVRDDEIQNAQRLQVTFLDGSTTDVEIRAHDRTLGYAILSAATADLTPELLNRLTPIALGSSGSLSQIGRPIIAVGAPTGELGSIAYGNVMANQQIIDLPDSLYKRITTNIYGSRTASGVLLDLDGRLIGITDMSYNDRTATNLLSAIGISELREDIERLSNGEVPVRLGIHGTDVTEAAAAELSVPPGAYVRRVEMDSPAMEAGLQSGDVIIAAGDAEVTRYRDLINAERAWDGETPFYLLVMRVGPGGYVETRLTVMPQ